MHFLVEFGGWRARLRVRLDELRDKRWVKLAVVMKHKRERKVFRREIRDLEKKRSDTEKELEEKNATKESLKDKIATKKDELERRPAAMLRCAVIIRGGFSPIINITHCAIIARVWEREKGEGRGNKQH